MVGIWWYSFYIAVLLLGRVTSLSRNRGLNYYDGSRGRMDNNYFTHDEFFQRNSRPKRTPHSPNLWAKSSESQGVSCPTRLRENSLDTLGDADRMKEVVHIPCPKRKSSGAKVVASFKGKSVKCSPDKRHNGNRGARELFRKNARGNDLNQAVRQNAQWLILSSQDRIQKPSQAYVGQNINSTIQTGQNWNMNQPLPITHQGMPTLERYTMGRNTNSAKEEVRKIQYSKSAQYIPQSSDSQLKPNIQGPQISVSAPPVPRLKAPGMLERAGPQFSPNQGYYNLGPPRNSPAQGPQVLPNQGPYPKNDKMQVGNPYEANRLLMNSYNMTYDGTHRSGSPNQPSYNVNPPTVFGQIPHPSVQGQMNPSFFQGHVTPANAIPLNTYLVVYNATMPSESPKLFQNTNETRNGPWVPGALEVEIPPGYPHQPKLPKTSTRSFEAVNIKDLPKADQKIPGSSSQPSSPRNDIQGAQYQYQLSPNEKSQSDSWRYRDNPYGNQHQQNPNMVRKEPQPSSYSKLAMVTSPDKTTSAYKGVFGKLKKEESKKLARPAKIPAAPPHARVPPASAQGGPAPHYGGNIVSNSKPDESASFLHQQEPRPRLQNSLGKNEPIPHHSQPKITNSKAVIPLRKMSSNDVVGHQGSKLSGDMSHVLNPPVTMDTSLYTNKAHKIASKYVSSVDVTYAPFRGVPPARNDEAFYDKNLNFLGKIDRPPLVNIKRHKWTKLNRRFNVDRSFRHDYPVGFYSEPADFHSDMSAEDFGTEHKPKSVDRRSRKCRRNRGSNLQRVSHTGTGA